MEKISWFLLVMLLACGPTGSKRESFFSQGNEALDRGEFEDAIAHFSNALDVDPDYSQAYNNRGVAHMENGHPHEAVMDYNRAILINDDYTECRLNRAYAYEAIAQFNNALEDIDFLIEQKPDSGFFHFYRGLITSQLRNYEESIRSFQRSIELGFENVDVLVNIGTVYFFIGDYSQARNSISEALSRQPRHAIALNTLALIAMEENDMSEAVYSIEKALEISPDEPFFLNNRGLIFLEMDSLDLGLKDINKSIVLNPTNGWAYRNKGIYYLKTGDFERALGLLERAGKSQDYVDDLNYYLGKAYEGMGDNLKACEKWRIGADEGDRKSKEMLHSCS